MLVGVDEHDCKRQRAEEVDLRSAEHAEGDDAVHLLGLAEGQTHKGHLVLVRHHLHQAGEGREPHIVPVRTDDPPIGHPDDQLPLALRRPPLPGGHVAQGVCRLEDPGPDLRTDRDVVILIEHTGDRRCGYLRRLGHILDGRHRILLSSRSKSIILAPFGKSIYFTKILLNYEAPITALRPPKQKKDTT